MHPWLLLVLLSFLNPKPETLNPDPRSPISDPGQVLLEDAGIEPLAGIGQASGQPPDTPHTPYTPYTAHNPHTPAGAQAGQRRMMRAKSLAQWKTGVVPKEKVATGCSAAGGGWEREREREREVRDVREVRETESGTGSHASGPASAAVASHTAHSTACQARIPLK